MNRITLSTTLVLTAATPFALPGADGFGNENPNRFSLGPRIGLNIKAKFHHNAADNLTADPGPATGGVNHNYDDGYVNVDASGNAGGRTWNWGYENASQVAGDTMQFHAIQSDAFSGSASRKADDAQYGVELIYQRILGSLSSDSSLNWGLEAGFSYTDLDLRDKRGGTAPVTVTTDTFQLNGVLPPGAGYRGTFDGPGPLLGDTPTRATAADTATLASSHKLSGQSFGFRLGPFAEFYFTPQMSLAASAGLALAPTCVEYDFSETTTLAGGGMFESSGHASETKWLYGYYLSAMLRYDFSESWGVYLGLQYQSLNDLKLSAGSATARLDQGAAVYGSIGATWRF
jgi:hypothetical protein